MSGGSPVLPPAPVTRTVFGEASAMAVAERERTKLEQGQGRRREEYRLDFSRRSRAFLPPARGRELCGTRVGIVASGCSTATGVGTLAYKATTHRHRSLVWAE